MELKFGPILNVEESLNWGFRVSKLTSTRHKNILLRIAHGDIYTKAKLNRFCMEPSDICPRCDLIENLNHKYVECDYVKKIWTQVKAIHSKLTDNSLVTTDRERYALGIFTSSTKAFMTLAAEILTRITGLKDEANYLIHPRFFVQYCLKSLAIKEKDEKIKNIYYSILNQN